MPDGIGWRKREVQRRDLAALARAGASTASSIAPLVLPQPITSRSPFAVAEHRRRLQRLLQRGELEAARAQLSSLIVRVVGDMARRGRARGRSACACRRGWPGTKRRARPVIASQS